MEIITSKSQDMERIISWKEIKEIVKDWDKSLKYYGVPRGGQPIAALLNPVDTIEECDVIVDDLVDSGATMKKYHELYPTKEFKVLIDKRYNEKFKGKWLKFPWEASGDIDVSEHMARVIQYFDDGNREGLQETPKRYIKFLKEFLSPPEFNFTVFDAEGMDEMIIQTNIPFNSLCEHHLAPFFGYAHIAYIPKDKIVGLSKLARTLETYSRRFQNQERVTQQVAERLQKELNAEGIAVVLTAQHTCMSMRGVKKHDTWTTTSKMLGAFKTDLNCRQEFLSLIKK
tara:strand:+ start:1492 stop:2346 length:855 start_codon:yes stop_codon:yes gene_type:complete